MHKTESIKLIHDDCLNAMQDLIRGGQNEYDKHTTPQVFIEPVDCLCCKHYHHCEKSNNVCDDFQLEGIS